MAVDVGSTSLYIKVLVDLLNYLKASFSFSFFFKKKKKSLTISFTWVNLVPFVCMYPCSANWHVLLSMQIAASSLLSCDHKGFYFPVCLSEIAVRKS